MYRQDYERAGYFVLPHGERRNQVMVYQAVLPALSLIVLSLVPTLQRSAGRTYTIGAEISSTCLLYYAARLAFQRTNVVARRLLLISILYLPVLFALMVLDKA
jgi:protoheme IX farnesyltransferase